MKILLPLALFVAVLLVYALWGREWLKSTPRGARFLSRIEPVELFLFKKSETILFGRMLQGLGGLLTILTQIGSIDITPFMPLVPDEYQGIVHVAFNCLPLVLNVLGAIVEKLRNETKLPIQAVAVTEKVIAENPALAEAPAKAEALKTVAVEAMAEAKAA